MIFELRSSKEKIFRHLTTPEKFVAAHPLIHRMEALGGNSYRVHERVKLGFIPCSFRYKATFVTLPDEVKIEATVAGLTRISMHIRLFAADQGTRVEEEVVIRSILPVQRIMTRLFREQHALLFRNIDRQS